MSSLNEAEFQAKIASTISKAFPLLPPDIRLEHYLKLKLGHHNVIETYYHDQKNVIVKYNLPMKFDKYLKLIIL